MSRELSQVARIEFDTLVKQEYQGMAYLLDTVTPRNNVNAGSYRARKIGKGRAQLNKGPSEDVSPMNISHDLVPIAMENATAAEYTDIFAQAEVNFDEKVELAQVIAGAIGRAEDQLIIDALASTNFHADAGAANAAVGTNVGGNATGMNLEKIRAGKRVLERKGIRFKMSRQAGMGQDDMHGNRAEVCMVMHTDQKDQLLSQTAIQSADYNSVKALVDGETDYFMGMKFVFIEDRDEGGLPKAASVRTCYMYAKSAILGVRGVLNTRTEVNYIPEKTSWLCNGLLKYAAGVRDAVGVIPISCTEVA